MVPSSTRRRARSLAPAFVVTVVAAVGGCADTIVDAPLGDTGAGAGGVSVGGQGGSSSAAGLGGAGAGAAGAMSGGSAGAITGGTSAGGNAGRASAGENTGGASAGAMSGGSPGADGGAGPSLGGASQQAGSAGVSGATGGGGLGGASGEAGAGGGAPGGSKGGGGSTPACPVPPPLMNDPCEGDIVCKAPTYCSSLYASCKGGRWKLAEKDDFPSGCNPPPPCPDEEPANADLDDCGAPQFYGWTHQLCRYARASCFTYLDCPSIYYGEDIPWRAGPYGTRPADSCCPAAEPAPGDACSEEGILCGWEKAPTQEYYSRLGASFVRELVCRNGVWGPRLNPLTLCPAELPKEAKSCDRPTPCTGYPDPDNDSCKTVTATCVEKKWKWSLVPVDGCPPAP